MEHAVVRSDGAVLRHLDAIGSKELAVRKGWVGSYTGFWEWACCVPEVKNVHIFSRKFSWVDVEVTEQPSMLVD